VLEYWEILAAMQAAILDPPSLWEAHWQVARGRPRKSLEKLGDKGSDR
jgi:hypothetical protein